MLIPRRSRGPYAGASKGAKGSDEGREGLKLLQRKRALRLRLIAPGLAFALLAAGNASAGPPPPPAERAPSGPSERGKAVPPLTRGPQDGLSRALEVGALSPARYALMRAQSLFRLSAVRRTFDDVQRAPQEAATAILRDLVLRIGDLDPKDQIAARRILARPDDPNGEPYGSPYSGASKTECSEVSGFCLHWASSASDPNRPPLADSDGDGVPDWVETNILTFDEVWAAQVTEFGFRAPKDDSDSENPGPDGRIDIYLAEIGQHGIYGYCTTDDPRAMNQKLGTSQYPYYDVSAYCVLDNDFSTREFPDGTPLSNLQVTAAHEFFHAIQSAYDFYEDWWMLEGTATAIEDLVFDDIDDNYQYLAASQFVRPEIPVDYSANDFSDPSFLNRYGSWIFWRFLTEHLSAIPGQADPQILREMWERADASPMQAYNDATSIRAASGTVMSRGLRFADAFSAFGASLYAPENSFDEAGRYLAYLRENNFGRAPFAKAKRLTGIVPTAVVRTRIDHLSHKLFSFARGDGIPPGARLRLRVEGPRLKRGAALSIIAVRSDGTISTRAVRLNRLGDKTVSSPFGSEVVRVIAVTSNASTRFARCNKKRIYSTSCGFPRDDGLRYYIKATII